MDRKKTPLTQNIKIMKNTIKTTEQKQIRLSINNQKCAIALKKGYQYNSTTGEIIGVRGRVIKAKINGYIVISFLNAGVKQFLYATTFIEFLLKNENEAISKDELEVAKIFVKPSTEYLLKVKASKEAKKNEVSSDKNLTEQLKKKLLTKNFLTKDKTLNYRTRRFFNQSFQFGVNRNSNFL